MQRITEHQTPFAKRMRRLGLDLVATEKFTKIPYATLRGYKGGRPVPRAAMRMLAAYRLLHWGEF